MSPRPRLLSDEAILAGAMRAIGRRGPARLTLADVAREVGVSPATLIQRFGSKRGLLLALASGATEGNRREFEALRRQHPSPSAALLAMADCMAQFAATPEEISNGLAFLQMDLTDPDFHRVALASGQGMDAEIRRLIAEALKTGELEGCQPARLARVLEATLHGSMVGWAIYRQGTLGDYIRQDLKTVLRPYMKRGARRVSCAARGRRR